MEEYRELLSLLIPITICIILITFIQFIKFIDYLIKTNEEIENNKKKKLKNEIKNEIIEYNNKTK